MPNQKNSPLDKDNLRQFIEFLQERFPGLTRMAIVELAGITRDRINGLLKSPNYKYIRQKEINGLFQVYDGLESGEMTYEPDKRGRRIRYPDAVPFDRQNLQQLIGFLQERFPGLTRMAIVELAGMTCSRLINLLGSPSYKYIRQKEINGLFQVYDGLESGEMTYKPEWRGRKPKKVYTA